MLDGVERAVEHRSSSFSDFDNTLTSPAAAKPIGTSAPFPAGTRTA